MKRWELLKTKLHCPICNSPVRVTYFKDLSYGPYMVCVGCFCEGPICDSELKAIKAWLILTGGPIPGTIRPPHDSLYARWSTDVLGIHEEGSFFCYQDSGGIWIEREGMWIRKDTPEVWYFIDRNAEQIRAWLEEDV